MRVVEGATGGARDIAAFDYHALRQRFRAAWMVSNGYTREMAIDAITGGYADLVAFGRPYIANPDLVERLRRGAQLNTLDAGRLFGGGAQGYTDYPALEAEAS